MGTNESPALQFTLASIPPQPTPAPTVVSSGTTTEAIQVTFTNTNSDTGGSAITLYELQMDDGLSGDFTTIYTSSHQTNYQVTSGITRGRYYRFRYRVENVIGLSEYSEVSYIQATTVPQSTTPPEFVSATSSTIELSIIKSVDSRGVDVDSHELSMSVGDDMSADFTVVPGYNGNDATYTVVSSDGLGSAGALHRFRVRVKNTDDAYSDYSDVLVVALGSVPAAPSAPTKDISSSGDGEIAVTWTALTGETLDVYGYRLYSDLGVEGGYSMIFDGVNQPEVL
mmetsp:Transcript_23476/g.36160  ORF Transcript_23476/g.36160 Transcript_23476/m.36160 type:complete len:283 (-) Transcript_23476:2952-3800(-)